MISKENFNYAVRNLMNRKVRSFLTILSILVGVATIFIFISFGWGLFAYMNEISVVFGVDKLIIQAKGIGAPGTDQNFKLLDGDIDTIEKTRGISQVGAVPFDSAAVKKDKKTVYSYLIGMPVDDEEETAFIIEFFTVNILEGRDIKNGDDTKVVLGYSYSQPNKLFEKPYKLGDKIEINGFDFKVVGFYDSIGNPSDDANVYVTMDAFKRIKDIDEVNFGFVAARVDNVDKIDEITNRVTRALRKHRGVEEGKEDFTVQSSQAMLEAFGSALNIVIGFIILIALISVVVSAVNTANTMFTSILERTKEIGVLKAIGAKNSEIMMVFLLESGILGFVAGVFGVLLGWILSYMGGLAMDFLGWGFLSPYFPWTLFVGCILFATIVGTVSGILPAYNASRKNPVDSLRYE